MQIVSQIVNTSSNMSMNLNDDDIEILQDLFTKTDINGDNFICIEDLRISSGIECKEKVSSLFEMIKSSAGANPDSLMLTFEEYCKGIMNFPCLLKTLGKNVTNTDEKSLNRKITTEFDEVRLIRSDCLKRKLQKTLSIYSKSLKSFEFDSDDWKDLIEALKYCIEEMEKSYNKGKKFDFDIIRQSLELFNLIRDLSQYHEEIVSNLKIKNEEYVFQIDVLTERNENLFKKIINLEAEYNDKLKSNEELFYEKTSLANNNKILLNQNDHLNDQCENIEEYFNKKIKETQRIIEEKEKEINKINKELRFLNSQKTLQKIKKNNFVSNHFRGKFTKSYSRSSAYFTLPQSTIFEEICDTSIRKNLKGSRMSDSQMIDNSNFRENYAKNVCDRNDELNLVSQHTFSEDFECSISLDKTAEYLNKIPHTEMTLNLEFLNLSNPSIPWCLPTETVPMKINRFPKSHYNLIVDSACCGIYI